jgi:hypothetical protein
MAQGMNMAIAILTARFHSTQESTAQLKREVRFRIVTVLTRREKFTGIDWT